MLLSWGDVQWIWHCCTVVYSGAGKTPSIATKVKAFIGNFRSEMTSVLNAVFWHNGQEVVLNFVCPELTIFLYFLQHQRGFFKRCWLWLLGFVCLFVWIFSVVFFFVWVFVVFWIFFFILEANCIWKLINLYKISAVFTINGHVFKIICYLEWVCQH